MKTFSGAPSHYSASFTLNTYAHATARMKRGAARTIEAVTGGELCTMALFFRFRSFSCVGQHVGQVDLAGFHLPEKFAQSKPPAKPEA